MIAMLIEMLICIVVVVVGACIGAATVLVPYLWGVEHGERRGGSQ